MKRLVICAALVSTLNVGTAIADGVSHSVGISADVAEICTFSAPEVENTTSNGFTGALSATSSNFVVNINQTTLTVDSTSGKIKFPNAFCNYNSFITLSRNGLFSDTQPIGNFKNRIHYTASAGWAGGEKVLLDADEPWAATESAPTTGQFEIEIDVPTSSEKLVSGKYQDTLTLTISSEM